MQEKLQLPKELLAIAPNLPTDLKEHMLKTLALGSLGVLFAGGVESLANNPTLFNSAFIYVQFLQLSAISIIVHNNVLKSKIPSKSGNELRAELEGVFPKAKVAVIVPTWNEPLEMVGNTLDSIAKQNYLSEKLLIVLSDDKLASLEDEQQYQTRKAQLIGLLDKFHTTHPEVRVELNIPPHKSSEFRRGEGKAGNLNSALELIESIGEYDYLVTQDADDLAADADFFRLSVSEFQRLEKLGYIQSVKKDVGFAADPFSNMDEMFYKYMQVVKGDEERGNNISCGSGVMYKMSAIREIKGFPVWSIVEDYTQSMVMQNAGFKGKFLPDVIGALGQSYPQDAKNLFKQRGTWARDQFQQLLGYMKDFENLQKTENLETKLDFIELPLHNIIAILTLLLVIFCSVGEVFDADYGLDSATMLANASKMAMLALPMATYAALSRTGTKPGELYKGLELIHGFAFDSTKAFFERYFSERDEKKPYIPTRKSTEQGIDWMLILPNLLILIVAFAPLMQDMLRGGSVNEIVLENYFFMIYAAFHITFVKTMLSKPNAPEVKDNLNIGE